MEPCKPRESERNRQMVYQSIRDMLNAHYSYRQIVATLKVSKKTIAKVSSGNIENLCQTSYQSIWDPYSNEMLDGIRAGKTGKEIYIDLVNRYKTIGKMSSFYNYIAQLAKDAGLKLERYYHRPTPLPDGTIPKKDLHKAKWCPPIPVEWFRNKSATYRLSISRISNNSHSKKTNIGVSRNFPMEKSILAVFVHRQLQKR